MDESQAVTTARQRTSASSNTSQFTCFKKLAPELQIMIWSFAISEPQLVFVQVKWFQSNYDDLPIMTAHIPSVLHVCRLSRALARKTYKPCFSQIFKHPVYFDQTKDRLVFKSVEAFSIFREEEAKAYCWDMVSVVLAEPLHDISEISPDLEIPFSWFAWRLIWKYY
jgi:hypothetical protein